VYTLIGQEFVNLTSITRVNYGSRSMATLSGNWENYLLLLIMKAMKCVFLCIVLNKKYRLKAELKETKRFTVLSIDALRWNSKFLIERSIFPSFWQPKLISWSQVTFSTTDRARHRKKVLSFLNFTLYVTWKIFVLLISRPVKGKTVLLYYICYC